LQPEPLPDLAFGTIVGFIVQLVAARLRYNARFTAPALFNAGQTCTITTSCCTTGRRT